MPIRKMQPLFFAIARIKRGLAPFYVYARSQGLCCVGLCCCVFFASCCAVLCCVVLLACCGVLFLFRFGLFCFVSFRFVLFRFGLFCFVLCCFLCVLFFLRVGLCCFGALFSRSGGAAEPRQHLLPCECAPVLERD